MTNPGDMARRGGVCPRSSWRVLVGAAIVFVACGMSADGGEFIRVQVGTDSVGRPVYEQVYQASSRDRFARSSISRGRAMRRIDRRARLVVGYEGPDIYWMPWAGHGRPICGLGGGSWGGGAVVGRAWVPGGFLPCWSGGRLGLGVAGSWMGIYWTR